MASLTDIVRYEVRWYASSGEGLGARLFPCLDDEHKNYAVIVVDYPARPSHDGTGSVIVMARSFGDKVIIEADNSDRPLYQRLMERHNVPRAKIILAYAGEAADETFARLPLPSYNDDNLTVDEAHEQPVGD